MNAKTFYHIIFVGNGPYKSRRKDLNNLKHQVHQLGAKLQEDDYLNFLMFNVLSESINGYVRRSILGMFNILIIKISKSKLEFQNPRS